MSYQVALSGDLHPGAEEGDHLSPEPQPIVAVELREQGKKGVVMISQVTFTIDSRTTSCQFRSSIHQTAATTTVHQIRVAEVELK